MALACLLELPHAAAQPRQPPPDRALHALFDAEYRYDLKTSPEYATSVGVDDYNDRLSDRSAAAVLAQRARRQALMRSLQAIPPRRLNTQDRISRELMLDQLATAARSDAIYGTLPFSGIDGWENVGPTSGPQFEFPALAKNSPFRGAKDYDNYLKRLAAMPLALSQMTDAMRIGMRSGWVPPAEVMTGVPKQFDLFIGADVTADPLYEPFAQYPGDMADADKERITASAKRVLAEQVQPAFAELKRFIEQDYIPACRKTLAASQLPGGMAYYTLAVQENTTTTLTPAEVHQIGLDEVARIGLAMDQLVHELGGKGTRGEFLEAMKADKRFYFTKPEDMLRAYRDIAKRVDAELPKLFAELPRLPYGVRAMEPYEGDNAEHYTPGAVDGSRAGYFEANVLSLATRPSYEMEDTFLHEAVPGHHLQTARAQEIPGLPAFRRSAWYVAYGEGWALYAESLGPLVGMYKDPYSRMGSYSWEMVRACRLVVDTGLHAQGWTRDQAIDYMVANAGIARAFAVSEVDRYIVDPGQALGYKIGELRIKSLRDKAKAALGERFDLRRFHNALLDDGALPLTVLESRIDEWIAAEQRRPVAARP